MIAILAAAAVTATRTRNLGIERVQRQRVTPGTETLWIGPGPETRSQRVRRVSGSISRECLIQSQESLPIKVQILSGLSV